MSRFFSERFNRLEPYVPGEQPKDMQYVKLNTNESPFPPAPEALARISEIAPSLQLYPQPDCTELCGKLAALNGVEPENVIVSNGSDETLYFAFLAWCGEGRPAVFPDITYGFYPVFADMSCVPYREIPLRGDLTIDVSDYTGGAASGAGAVFIANPNAPTGIALEPSRIEEIAKSDPDRIVVVDEAYVDFGAESCVPLTKKYDNVFVVQTFSKSRSMAGARLGFGIGSRDLIADLMAIKYSTNPYNINRMTMAAGLGALASEDYTRANCATIARNREYTAEALRGMGFAVTDSKANFVFAKSPDIGGEELYLKLKEQGVLIRHFGKERIKDWNRITIGTREQMDILLERTARILEEKI
jgi:histidinol-phosphate aminotransferase